MKPDPLLFELQQLTIDLALVERNHHLAKHPRSENDIEHSFAVTLFCWSIVSRHELPLNLERILKYALIHDFLERYAGDINTYASTNDRAKKIVLEKQSLNRMTQELKDFPDLVQAMHSYEDKADDEAKFVWTVDKMQALVLADMDGWRPYQKIDIKYDQFLAKHTEQLQNASPYIKDIFRDLLEYCKTTYYDRPAKDPGQQR